MSADLRYADVTDLELAGRARIERLDVWCQVTFAGAVVTLVLLLVGVFLAEVVVAEWRDSSWTTPIMVAVIIGAGIIPFVPAYLHARATSWAERALALELGVWRLPRLARYPSAPAANGRGRDVVTAYAYGRAADATTGAELTVVFNDSRTRGWAFPAPGGTAARLP